MARASKIVPAGQAASFDFNFDDYRVDGNRVEIRAVIAIHNPPGDKVTHNPPADKAARATVEVFDAITGKTTASIQPELDSQQ